MTVPNRRRRSPTSSDQLLRTTRVRLAAVTLGLIVLLVAGIGLATAWTGISALEGNVDRALQAAADAKLARLEGTLPAGSGESSSGGEGADEEVLPGFADTFELFLDSAGNVIANPSGVALPGLPDQAAVAAAAATGSDLRTVHAGGVPIRLLTEPILPHETEAGSTATPIGFLQVGFVLTLHEQQMADLIRAILIVGLAGIAAAALITVYVTGRALVPIRAAFEHERRFVADASHEIRTPTALIRASAEVVAREGLVSDAGKPLIEDVISESDRLARLVGDLLTLTSSGAGSLVVEKAPIDLVDVARDTVRRAGPLAEERRVGLALETDGAPAALPIVGDRDRLIQLLLILLDNAFGHSPAGGVVTVGLGREARRAIVTVDDQGPGIPVDERDRIFEPFARLRTSRSSGEEGSGLGLAIARAIVERHDGTIGVDDAPDGGARFVVVMPLA